MMDREAAIELATRFIIENGYTEEDESVPIDELYLDSAEQVLGAKTALTIRHDSIEKTPCETEEDASFWYVKFRTRDNPKTARVVCVDKESGVIAEMLLETQPLITAMSVNEKQERADKHIKYATAYRLKSMLPQAIQELEKAIQLDPTRAIAYNNLGTIYKLTGDREKAVMVAKQAVRLKPDDAEFRNNLGVILLTLGKRDEAISEMWQAVKYNPKNLTTYYNLALLYTEFDKRSALLCWEQLYGVLHEQGGREEFSREVEIAIYKLRSELSIPISPKPATATVQNAESNQTIWQKFEDSFFSHSSAWIIAIIVFVCLMIAGVWFLENQGPLTTRHRTSNSFRVLSSQSGNATLLSDLKRQIETIKALIPSQGATLLVLEKELSWKSERIRVLGQYPSELDEYNRFVGEYNSQLARYNALHTQYEANVARVNRLVSEYNSRIRR